MKALIIGKSGQLANELVVEHPQGTECIAVGRSDIDITSQAEVSALVTKFKPDVIINASAYTAVDKAESDNAIAYAINATAVELLAKVAEKQGCRFIHVSTDFVFDGLSNEAYQVDSPTNPQSVYGATKLAGEELLQQFYPENSIIVRTSWVYSTFGNNFVKTMLKLMAEKESLNVVADQIGCPTNATGLASFIWRLAEQSSVNNVYHWSDAGVASWYDFALAIQELAVKYDLLSHSIPVNAIPTCQYPTPAARPKFSLLDLSASTSIYSVTHWRKQLEVCIKKLAKN